MPPTPDTGLQSVPEYALKHAPIVWLHKDDEFFPSHVVEHLLHVNPKTFAGVDVDVPADIKNKVKALSQSDVNKGDVFLTLDVRRASTEPDVFLRIDPRKIDTIPTHVSNVLIRGGIDWTCSEGRQGEPEDSRAADNALQAG